MSLRRNGNLGKIVLVGVSAFAAGILSERNLRGLYYMSVLISLPCSLLGQRSGEDVLVYEIQRRDIQRDKSDYSVCLLYVVPVTS